MGGWHMPCHVRKTIYQACMYVSFGLFGMTSHRFK